MLWSFCLHTYLSNSAFSNDTIIRYTHIICIHLDSPKFPKSNSLLAFFLCVHPWAEGSWLLSSHTSEEQKGSRSNSDTFTRKSTDLSCVFVVSLQYFLLRLQSICDCYFPFLSLPPPQHLSPAHQRTHQDEEGEGCSPVTLSAQLWFLPFLHSPSFFACFLINSQS